MFASAPDLAFFWLDISLKSLLLGGAAAAVMAALRIRNCALRHRVWTAVMVAMLLMPLLAWLTPTWQAPVGWALPEVVRRSPIAAAARPMPALLLDSTDFSSVPMTDPTSPAEFDASRTMAGPERMAPKPEGLQKPTANAREAPSALLSAGAGSRASA